MFLTPEQRTDGEALLKDTEAKIQGSTDTRTCIYYEAKARGLRASLDENPQIRWREVFDDRILSKMDSPNEGRRIDSIGYGDGFHFNEPGLQIGIEHLEFRYSVETANSYQDDLGRIWMERFPDWRRQCLYIDYPQPENSPVPGMRPGHFRFRQIPGEQFMGQFHHPHGVFPFEGNGIRDTYIESSSVEEACDRFFARFNVPKSRYSLK